jgi:hypothetical protein
MIHEDVNFKQILQISAVRKNRKELITVLST